MHRLNRDEQGRVKCVACFLCATACPAHCIDIVGVESPWPDREKYPESFTIDELRCIFCGMCEEACPVDAIELTSLYDLTGRSREEMIFDKEKLLSVYDQTKDAEPMQSAATAGGTTVNELTCSISCCAGHASRVWPHGHVAGRCPRWRRACGWLAAGARARSLVARAGLVAGSALPQLPGLGDWLDDGVFYRPGRRDGGRRRGHGHVSQPGLLGHLVRRCRCWARPGCSCFRGRSFWAWPRSWSMPGRSW